MTATTARFPIWFLAAALPMIAAQMLRLQQTEAAAWLLCDYAGRLGTIAVLAAMPVARRVAFARPAPTMDAGRIAIWIVALWLATIFGIDLVKRILVYGVPVRPLGFYPKLDGWLRGFDLAIGLWLVAYSEELLFRRCARVVFARWLGDGWAMVLASALLFGAFHWWTGPWNALAATVTGALLMQLHRRANVLWAAVVAHYCIDLFKFSLW
jgi:hypothetical protein